MSHLHLCKWWLLAALLLIGSEGAPESDPWITPIQNIDAAMEGFDPIRSNPLESPDPGIRNQIFEPMSILSDGRVVVNSFVDKVREDLHCDTELTSTTLRNYNEYREAKSSGHQFAFNADVSVEAGSGNFSFSYSVGYGRQSTDEEINVQKLFQETNGDIVESKAQCITHSVGISLFERPVFTAAFTTALKELNLASKTPDSESSRGVYAKFVQSYGTHFMKTTFLGSKLIFEKRFTSKILDTRKQSARTECVTNAAHASLGLKAVTTDVGESFQMTSKGCESEYESNPFFQRNRFSSEKVISIGPLPHGDLQNWANTAKVSPVPIYYELEKISSLFQSKWFNSATSDDTDLYAEKLNGTAMYDFFEGHSSSVCQLLLGENCNVVKKGCGYNSLCSEDQTCVNEQTTDLGYTCNQRNKYGPALIVGGYNGGYVTTSDAIDTWILPNLPYSVYGLTLARVGSKFYACGGHRHNVGAVSSCYVIDRDSESPRWELIASLPSKMYHHTSVTIGDHIWTVYDGKLYDLDTNTNQIHTFNLPLTVTSGHCAVSNGSHSIIIGAGSLRNEIWINTEEYNPAKWHKVGYLRAGTRYHGCVWFEKEVVITGGEPARVDAVAFDTEALTLRSAGMLAVGRRHHGMIVLDGRTAVLGGFADKFLSSIETYDANTGIWSVSSRSLLEVRSHFGLVQLHE